MTNSDIIRAHEHNILDAHARLSRCKPSGENPVCWRMIGDPAQVTLNISSHDDGYILASKTASGEICKIDDLNDIHGVLKYAISKTLQGFRNTRKYVADANLHQYVSDDVTSEYQGRGVGYWIYCNEQVIPVLESGNSELEIVNAIYTGPIDDIDYLLWAFAVNEGYLYQPITQLTTDPTDVELALYFYELAVRGALYHLDDDPSALPFTRASLSDSDRDTLISNDIYLQSHDRSSGTDLWDLFSSRPCLVCNEHTFVDSTKCSNCQD